MSLSTIVRAEDDFKGLSPQDRMEQRDVEVSPSELNGIFEAYGEDMKEAVKDLGSGYFSPRHGSNGVYCLIPDEVSKKYIEQFIGLIKPHQSASGFSEVLSYYLPELISRCSDTSFNIDLSAFNKEVRIGFNGCRRKRIKIAGERLERHIATCLEEAGLYIKGDIGSDESSDGIEDIFGLDYVSIGMEFGRSCLVIKGSVSKRFKDVGEIMRSGKIHIRGNCYAENVGSGMGGGRIIIDGDCNSNVGLNMWEGSITIRGRATGTLGENMHARGRIYVKGESEPTIGENCCGTIYHNGKLFIDKGRRVSE